MKAVDKIRTRQPAPVKRSIGYEDGDKDVRDASKELKRMRIAND